MDFFWPLRHQSPRRFKSRTWNQSNESLKLDELLWKSGVQNHCVKSKGAEQFELYLRCHSNRIAMILVHGGGHFCCVPRLSSWPWKKQTPPNNPTFVWYFTGWDLHQVSWCAAGISGIDEVKCIEATTVLWFNVASMIDEWWWMQMNQWMHFFEVVWPAFSCSMRIGRGDFRFFLGGN